jgi:hypothetical protein
MAVNGDYSTPVYVNGYACWNCTDVANAKKDIDPAHPQSGQGGVDAKSDPTAKATATSAADRSSAVSFGGVLSAVSVPAGGATNGSGLGGRFDLSI